MQIHSIDTTYRYIRVDTIQTARVFHEARTFELAKHLAAHLSTLNPHLLPVLQPIFDNLKAPTQKKWPTLVILPELIIEEHLLPPSKKTMALALLAQHPDWSDSRIAREVPCSRTSLYEWEEFVTARRVLRSGRAKYQRDCTIDAHE